MSATVKSKMGSDIKDLQTQILALQEQLAQKYAERRQKQFHYKTSGRKVVFDTEVRRRHVKQRTGVIAYLKKLSWKTYLTGPVVYFMIVPFAFLDLCVTLFQTLCFWAWGIPRAKRSDYVFIDRHQLAYLNRPEKLFCVFCGYANGVTAFTREVAGRAEKYWCPIKHACKVYQEHQYYKDFTEFGDADAWHSKDRP